MNQILISNLSIENDLLKVTHNKFSAPLRYLLQYAEKLYFNQGHVLYHAGNIARGMYIISKGKVKLSKFGIEGKEQIIKIVHNGDVMGHEALLNDQRFHEDAEVLEDAEVYYVGREDFEKVCNHDIAVLNYLTKLICKDLNKVEEQLVAAAYEPVRGRLASILLMLSKMYEKDGKYIINLSRSDLANLAGTAKETSIRLISELKGDGVLDVDGQNIIIKDLNALKQVAGLYKSFDKHHEML